jgi:GMP synthase (glutamine-hydrolysing)
MTKLLIVNCTPEKATRRLAAEGGRASDVMFMEAVGRHDTACGAIESFTLDIADGAKLPQGVALADFDGVWISGSPLAAYRTDLESVRTQIEFARTLWESEIPSFGTCFGLQLMTAALGGTVHLNPRGREIGVARGITISDAGASHPMYRDKRHIFDALCSHEDEVASLPSGAVVLASNSVSPVQAMSITDGAKCFWGVQYHPEFEFTTTAGVIKMRAQRHVDEGLARDLAEVAAIVEDFRAIDRAPERKDLAWRYGLTPDVLDPRPRTLEFRNWLNTEVAPVAARR